VAVLITETVPLRRGMASLTNVVRIISREWRLWLDRGRVQKIEHHGHQK
jgi:hypothetical protein